MGTLYNLTGATIGATLAFLLARYLAADWVKKKTGGKLKRLSDGVESEGWRFVAFVRLVPLFPFNLLNYALGLTRIRLSHFIIASYIFMLPGAIAYTFLGHVAAQAVNVDFDLKQMIQLGVIALALLGSVAFLPRLIGRLRQRPMLSVQELKQRMDKGEDILILDVRTRNDFVDEQGHIAVAKNLPLEELSQRVDELNEYLEKPIALVCRTDKRSARAAHLLTEKGFADVHIVRGGMTEWNKAGYQVV
jgi:rhodanese-related sulfurtransferase